MARCGCLGKSVLSRLLVGLDVGLDVEPDVLFVVVKRPKLPREHFGRVFVVSSLVTLNDCSSWKRWKRMEQG